MEQYWTLIMKKDYQLLKLVMWDRSTDSPSLTFKYLIVVTTSVGQVVVSYHR